MHHSGLSQPSSAGDKKRKKFKSEKVKDNATNRTFVNAGIGLQRSTTLGVELVSVNSRRSSPQSKY